MTRPWDAVAVAALWVVHLTLALLGAWGVLTSWGDGWGRAWLGAWALPMVGGTALLLHGWRRWGQGVRLAGLLALVALVLDFTFAAWPQRAALFSPQDAAPLQAMVRGRALLLQGDWQRGDGARIAAFVRQQPELVRLQLQGGGLALSEATPLAGLMAERKMDTQAVGPCQQACALVFFQGKRRHLMPGAQVGLARLPEPTGHPLARWWMRAELQQRFAMAGVPPVLQQSALQASAASRAWFEADPFWTVGALTQAHTPLDVDLPHTPGDVGQEYAQALAAHPVWQGLERRFPGLLAQVAQRMWAARRPQAAGGRLDAEASDEAAWQVAREAAYERLPTLLQHANAVERLRYVALLGKMAAGASDPQVCEGVVGVQAQARRQLPADALGDEARWMHDASHQEADPPKPLNALEQEVLRRSLGHAAVADWSRLWRSPSNGVGLSCRSALSVLARVQALPIAQRTLAVRAMF